ncbi:MAG: Gfo/Idh/MocA family oxidoreductase [candidate division Zixibacteria bacterium]|nr:Gfo/Idh/MocA family oxidoreductase [candidate division Zixibacteria bacterium]
MTVDPKPLRMAQYGTKHGHAAGKLQSMLTHPDVEVVGVYEPDMERRKTLRNADGTFRHVRWFDTPDEMLNDPSIEAVASEGLNAESLDQTEAIVRAGKHVWYDKPAGDDWPQWRRVVALARKKKLHLQMGYMFRYHPGFRTIADWARSGLLGDVFSIRAHMSTNISPAAREVIAVHRGGILYDLGGHMLDQIVWILGRPTRVSGFFRNAAGVVPQFMDNTLGVLAYDRALAFVDIAAMEPGPAARRFEVYGTRGTAILLEPFEPGAVIRLVLTEPAAGFSACEQRMSVEVRDRQAQYDHELEAFVATVRGRRPPDRPYEHDLAVQETLLRITRLDRRR